MKYGNNKYEDIKIAYIGGGSRGWAWGFMSDLAVCEDMCGTVYLYDIDLEAAKKNEKIGNGIKDIEGCKSQWKYKDVETEKEALEGADFVVISIYRVHSMKWKAMYIHRKNTIYINQSAIRQVRAEFESVKNNSDV